MAPVVGSILLTVCLTFGCKPKQEAVHAGVFNGPFQTESEFIVQAVVSDLAEQMFYAKFQRLPNAKRFLVVAKETPGTPLDTAEYVLEVKMDSVHTTSKVELDLNQPIWSPAVYQGVAKDLAKAVGLELRSSGKSDDTSALSNLIDVSPRTIEDENTKLSQALESNFNDAGLHEQAATLLGTFALREHSGYFFDIRFPLSRMTAHLAMARCLNGADTYGINGQMAEAMLLTLTGNESAALNQLGSISTNNAAVAAFIRALQTRNSGDYRILDATDGLLRVESIEWFCTRSAFVGTPVAWLKLSDDQRQTIDFVRIAHQMGYSVEMGHQLLAVSIPLELQEIGTVYQLSQHRQLTKENFIKALNELPERCFSKSDGAVHVRVIGWGQWANFLQHHLCHAIEQDFDMMQNKWGVPDDAKEFAAKCDQAFSGLRLYPFVQRMDATEVETYHQSQDACIKLIFASPQLVPTGCWNWTFHRASFAPAYPQNYDPHLNEWFVYNPPLGTVYDLSPRLYHPTVVDRSDAVAYFEKLRALAPYDYRIANVIVEKKYNNHATYDQVVELYGKVLPYSVDALCMAAEMVQDKPDQYEKLMAQAGELNPGCYYQLAEYFSAKDEGKAEQYRDKACDNDPDRVRAANGAIPRVQYYLKKGNREKARAIADDAADSYSATGLTAEGLYQELTGNYDAAFEWYAKIEERYDDSTALVDFCARYRAKTGSTRFDAALQARSKKLFPQGMETVSLKDFHGPPTDGVVFKEQSNLMTAAGLKEGDVIVAVYGVHVHNTAQYEYGRGMRGVPELDLIVWQGDGYREIKASPPNHLFGVDIGDYTPR